MSTSTTFLTSTLYHYLQDVSLRESPVLAQLRRETAKMPGSQMQIAPEQGQFMALLVELLGVRHALEIGTFTGYSALAVAQALPPGGELICCDIDAEVTKVAQRFWQQAGVNNKIDLRIGPAVDTLADLINNKGAGHFDFVFIDADKANYDTYYEQALILLKRNGLIVVDNVLWGGKVAESNEQGNSTVAIRDLNEKIKHDPRVNISLVPIGDGLLLCRKC